MDELSVDCPNCGAQSSVPVDTPEDLFTCAECGTESPIDDAIAGQDNAAPDYLVDQLVGDCKIVEKVGEGGFGSVYRAVDQNLQRDVALKVMLPSLTTNQEFVRKFIREAVTAAQLNHPNIVAIHKVGKDDKRGLHFLIMEFVQGDTLNHQVKEKGVLSLDESIALMLQACDALAAAHERNIVHRDIKPENLMVTRTGLLKITDFGLAKSLSTSQNTTKVMGTPHYMSPEQFEGKGVDGRSDIYSLGVTFYFLLSKNRPYEGQNTVQIIYSILTQDPKPIQDFNASIPEGVWDVIKKMIAKKPEDRYQTLRDTIVELKKFQETTVKDRSVCPSCSARNPKGRKFCRGCGTALIVRCPSCSSQEAAGTAECSQCGADIGRLLKVKKALDSATKHKTLGDLRRAADAYDQVLELEPDNDEAKTELGTLRGALQEMDHVSRAAEELIKTGDLESAQRQLEQLLTKYPTASELREQRDRVKQGLAARRINKLVEEAEEAVEAGQIPRALELLDSALRDDPSREDVRARRTDLGQQVAKVATTRHKAAESLAAGRYEEAFTLASEVLQLVPGDTAMEDVRRKAHSFVESVDSFLQRGRQDLEDGKLQEALGEFEAALSVRPGDKELLGLVNSTRKRITEHRDALARCRQLMAERQFDQAIEVLEATLRELPDDREAKSLAAQCEKGREEAQKARAVQKALTEANRLFDRGRYEQSLEQYERVLELDPRNEEARMQRAQAEQQAQQERDVRELADEHLQDGRYDEATLALERLKVVNPAKTQAIDDEIGAARKHAVTVKTNVDNAERALARKDYRGAQKAAQGVLAVAPRHPRAGAIEKEAEKALTAIERFLSECDRLTLSEMFDEAMEALDRARERGCTQEEYDKRHRICIQGQTAALKADATHSLEQKDFEAAIAVYEQVLEVAGEDEDALRAKRQAERRLRISTTEPLALRLGAAAVVTMMLGLVQFSAMAATQAAVADVKDVLTQSEIDAQNAATLTVAKKADYVAAIAAENQGNWAEALAAYRVQAEEFPDEPAAKSGIAFNQAMKTAFDTQDLLEQSDRLVLAEAHLGDAAERRDRRAALLQAAQKAAIDQIVFRLDGLEEQGQLVELETLMDKIEASAVSDNQVLSERIRNIGKYIDALKVAQNQRSQKAFPDAAETYDYAFTLVLGDSWRTGIVQSQVKVLEGEWMDDLRAKAATNLSDEEYFDQVIQGLAAFEKHLKLSPEKVAEMFDR